MRFDRGGYLVGFEESGNRHARLVLSKLAEVDLSVLLRQQGFLVSVASKSIALCLLPFLR